MPPFELWLRGPDQVAGWLVGQGAVCENARLLPVRANGAPAFACYHPAGEGRWEPWCIQVMETNGEQITGWHNYIGPEQFPRFGVPEALTA